MSTVEIITLAIGAIGILGGLPGVAAVIWRLARIDAKVGSLSDAMPTVLAEMHSVGITLARHDEILTDHGRRLDNHGELIRAIPHRAGGS